MLFKSIPGKRRYINLKTGKEISRYERDNIIKGFVPSKSGVTFYNAATKQRVKASEFKQYLPKRKPSLSSINSAKFSRAQDEKAARIYALTHGYIKTIKGKRGQKARVPDTARVKKDPIFMDLMKALRLNTKLLKKEAAKANPNFDFMEEYASRRAEALKLLGLIKDGTVEHYTGDPDTYFSNASQTGLDYLEELAR